jgi:adenylate kinase
MVPSSLVLIMLGPPGSGKGTQAKMLEEKLQLPHISTGDLLRNHVRRDTHLGKQAQGYMDKGNLVPDALILDMLFERVSQNDCSRGYILDGFPRTIPQAEALQQCLKEQPAPVVLNLNLSDAKVIERLTKRVVCEKCGSPYHLVYSPPKIKNKCDTCGGKLIHRPDDTEAVITKRLKVYQEQTAPLIAFYSKQKLLHTIDCSADKNQVFKQVLLAIKEGQPLTSS